MHLARRKLRTASAMPITDWTVTGLPKYNTALRMTTTRFIVLMMENVSSDTSPSTHDEQKLPMKCIMLHMSTLPNGKLATKLSWCARALISTNGALMAKDTNAL